MKKHIIALIGIGLFILQSGIFAADKGEHLNTPPPDAAKQLLEQGIKLAENDRPIEALDKFKKAIAIAPNYVKAHSQYIKTRVYFLGQYDEVMAEYEKYMRQEPDNPVYPMAVFLGQSLANDNGAWLKKTAEIAPEWSWGHYAKALLLLGRDNEAATAELLKSIEKNPAEPAGYIQAIHFQRNILRRVDDAMVTVEKMKDQPDLRETMLSQRWLLELAKGKFSDEAKQTVNTELVRLASTSTDIKVLSAIYQTYVLLKDTKKASAIEEQIHKIDAAWYPERGKTAVLVVTGEDGIPRQIATANHQTTILNALKEMDPGATPDEKIDQLSELLAMKPNRDLETVIGEGLFRASTEAKDDKAVARFGEGLLTRDPKNPAVLALVSLALTNQKIQGGKAKTYAEQAVAVTAEFHAVQRPANTDQATFTERFPEKAQIANYKKMRALALDALGWQLYQSGDYQKAEAALRQSVQSQWFENNLNHLSDTLQKLGRGEEAQKISADAKKVFVDSITSKFTNVPLKELAYIGMDGKSYKLTDLKGKLVMLSFWGTWCVPCRKEMPLLSEAYKKYKDQGFEIVAITTEGRQFQSAVETFVKNNRMTFAVGFSDDAEKVYNFSSYPTNIFIDRQGKIRYRSGSFTDERVLETVITELLK